MLLLRIGVQIEPNDSFWIQVEETIYHGALCAKMDWTTLLNK